MVDMVTVLSILIPVLASILASVASLAYWLGRKFALIDERFERINENFRRVDERFEMINERFKAIDERFKVIDERFKAIDERFERIDERFKEIDRRFREIDERFKGIDERFERIERGISGIRDVFIQYNEILLSVLESRGVVSRSEVLALKGVLGPLRPRHASKYYTKEVERRLDELLAKDPEELTLSELEELDRIADLIWNEGYESGRMDLREYGMKLKLYVMMVKVVFIYPKLRKLREEGIVKP